MSKPAPPPLCPNSEDRLLEMWHGRTAPLVSIICPTFNHADFVASTLDGFLGQVTDFPFEIVVRDDASTDGTADVIRSYCARYPRIIRPIFERENTFSRGVSFLPPLLRSARGEFIATCAGDDYWIDPGKLSAQVAALRQHPAASMCFHDYVTVCNGEDVCRPGLRAGLPMVIDPFALSLPIGWFPMPLTWLYRREACDFEAPEFDAILNEDNLLLSQFARFGPAVRLDGRLAAYRLHDLSIYSSKSERQKYLSRLNSFLWISRYHFRTGCGRLGRRFALAAASLASHDLRTFGRSVTWWSVVMFARVMLVGSIDPSGRLRRAVGKVSGSH